MCVVTSKDVPIVQNGVLVGGSHQQSEQQLRLPVGSPDWFRWLEQAFAFDVLDPPCHMQARKERRANGWYWYAYYRRDGHTHRAYLGKSAGITQERLNEIAHFLITGVHPPPLVMNGEAAPAAEERPSPFPLLATKVVTPPLRLSLLVLPHAHDQLQCATNYPLTLMSAPAGFGKTKLLAQWAKVTGLPVAWISLDENDNDPAHFWTYVLTALDALHPGMVRHLLPSSSPAKFTASALLLSNIINALSLIPDPVFLILDDYHAIHKENHAIHDHVAYLLEYLPPHDHVIISSRVDPPLPLARYRVRGQLNEIRTGDLRMTLDESTLFLSCMGISLSSDEMAFLDKHIEGWVTGWQLAALSLQRCADLAGWVDTFSGANRYVGDFLTEEVLNCLSPHTLTFLMQTALLERFSASLCEAVTGMENCQAILLQLEQENLFIEPLDEQRRWYRYHPLFAGALLARLNQAHADEISEYYRRASVWCGEHGFIVEAAQYAHKTGDLHHVAVVMNASYDLFLQRGEVRALMHWLSLLPDAVLADWPYLCAIKGHLLPFSLRQESMDEYIRHAEARLASAPPGEQSVLHGEMLVLRAALAMGQNDANTSLGLLKQAEEYFSSGRVYYPYLMLDLGFVYQLVGDLTAAGEIFDTLLQRHDVQGNVYLRCASGARLAALRFAQGRLSDVIQISHDVLPFAEHHVVGSFYLVLGQALYERNDLAGAHRALQAFVNRHPVPALLAVAYSMQALICEVQGDSQRAGQLMEWALMKQEENMWPAISATQINQVRLWMLQDNLAVLDDWAGSHATRMETMNPAQLTATQRIYEDILRVRLCLLRGHTREALALLSMSLKTALAEGRRLFVTEILILRALVCDALGDQDAAARYMQRALALAEPEEYVRVFVDNGTRVKQLLLGTQLQQSTDFLKKILAAFGSIGESQPAIPRARAVKTVKTVTQISQALFEPLSVREIQILQLLAQGLSNGELAQKLVIAVGTVKRHLSNIFQKLGVQSRTQAVARAAALDLVRLSNLG
jgi:LuxR family transcriptional regulator, maltose regulon positive regulatory protein